MTPKWIDDALVANAALDLDHEERDLVAAAILDSLPMDVIIAAIAGAASTVLKERGIADGAHELATEIAKNATHSVCVNLQRTEVA